MSSCLLFWHWFMLLRFCPFVGFWRFHLWMYVVLMTCILGDVWLISAATVDEFYICMLFEFWCEDVASISWIFILFVCIIALIEIGRYNFYGKFQHQKEHYSIWNGPYESFKHFLVPLDDEICVTIVNLWTQKNVSHMKKNWWEF